MRRSKIHCTWLGRPRRWPGAVSDQRSAALHYREPRTRSPCESVAVRVFVSVEAELGFIGEVGAELQKERSAVAVHAIDVEVVHHGRGPHQPRIADPGLFIPAALGTEHRRLLLRLPDKHHSLGLIELLTLFGGEVVLALTFTEPNDGDLLPLRILFQRCHERLADGIHPSAGDERVPPMVAKEAHDTLFPL